MAYHQLTTVDSDRIWLGNYQVEVAPSAAGTYVNLGAGQLTSWKHNFSKFSTQAGNAPDPIEGIAEENVTFGFDLLEYDASAFSAAMAGLVTATITTGQSVLDGGGNQVLTTKAWRLTNTRLISGTTVTSIITHYKGTVEDGMNIVTKSDNDTDPMNAFQFTVKCELDTTLTVGSQLFNITRVEV